MNVKLKTDYTVCRDGIHPESFKTGAEVALPAPIATVLLEDGRAALPGAPENKALPGAPESKGGENLGPGRKKRGA